MSTTTTALPGPAEDDFRNQEDTLNRLMWTSLETLGSLKLTCVLLVMGMFVVFVGSLAQARRDVWLVVHQYFRTYLAWIDVKDLFPPSMFPSLVDYDWNSLGVFQSVPFPGGWTIGWLMLANLVTAHCMRFRIRATTGKLLAGIATIAGGMLLTFGVVFTGNSQTGVEYADTLLAPETIWTLMMVAMFITSITCFAMAIIQKTTSPGERFLLALVGFMLGAIWFYFWWGGEATRINLSGMRILWQLIKGTACAAVLLIGCVLLFEKRGGIVVLHMGIALLMISELQVGFTAKETQMTLQEGESRSYVKDIRSLELAVVNRVGEEDHVVIIPEDRLLAAVNSGEAIKSDELPFAVRVDEFARNTVLRSRQPGEEKTTAGLGTFATAVKVDNVTGMDGTVDMSAVKVTVVDASEKELESRLCALEMSERTPSLAEEVTVDGKDYQLYLRFQRSYRDYNVELLDVSRTNYVGTATPRDFRSKLRIRDNKTDETSEYEIWMNNPLRWGTGETFYQTNYMELPSGEEISTISIVKNDGWMLPYIACMIAAVGMFWHFGIILRRYLARLTQASGTAAGYANTDAESDEPQSPLDKIRQAKNIIEAVPPMASTPADGSLWPTLLPIFAIILSGVWVASAMRTPKPQDNSMNLYEFAQIPVAWRGRPQPIDSVARTELLMISHKSSFEGELNAAELDVPERREKLISRITKYWSNVKAESLDGFTGNYETWIEKIMKLTSSGREAVELRVRDVMVKKRMQAVRWYLDLASNPEAAERHRVIKIDDDQVLALLKLEKRPGLRYSLAEILPGFGALEDTFARARQMSEKDQESRMTQLERHVLSLVGNIGRVRTIQESFQNPEPAEDLWGVMQAVSEQAQSTSQSAMMIPTGVSNAENSWKTAAASANIHRLIEEFNSLEINSKEEAQSYFENTLPKKSVDSALTGSLEILKQALQETSAEEDVTPEQIKSRALAGSRSPMLDGFIRRILALIGNAKAGATAEEIIADISDEQYQEIAAERISADEIADVFEKLDANLEDLPYGGDASETFQTGTQAIGSVLAAWSKGDVDTFNTSVADYRTFLATTPMEHLDDELIQKETFFNLVDPFWKSIYLYLFGIILTFISWIAWSSALRRTGFALMAVAFIVHTIALIARMQISGRPPVTNLYSSAIFIGWAVVLSAFMIEFLQKNGLGNILGSAVGAGTLVIAHYLARGEGDTLGVMQAVLDTTFWLATHVVCITLGYAATFLAGTLAIAYCFRTVFCRGIDAAKQLQLGRMIYGVLCFAIFFSLVGTVLGGLWADDSWGRFWGWDPKENGAMMIVMWNALILHARWDKMVRDYGTAVLAIIGNIVTAWSWFGVNELSAGLHNYGFTEGRLLALIVFISSQLIIIAAALIPVIGRSSKNKIGPA